jgi:hypothetical protein
MLTVANSCAAAEVSLKLIGSVTRRFVTKSAQFCQNIAQNGASLNNNFCPKKLLVKIWEFKDKI